jgi:multidrug resistance efflux pump
MNRAWIFVPLVLIAIGVLWWSQRRGGEELVSGFIESDRIRVGSHVGGRVQTVHVEEGDRVARGAPLITLEPFDLNERLAEAKATLEAREATLAKLEAGFRAEEIAEARAERDRFQATLEKLKAGPRALELQILRDKLEVARAEAARAQTEFDRIRRLREGGELATPEEIDNATRGLESAQARFAAARDELALGEEGTRVEEIAEAEANLAQAAAVLALREKGYRPEERDEARAQAEAARAAVATIQRQLDELEIVAPVDCIVEAVELRPGDLIAPNAPVISLLDPNRLWVRAYVPENRLDLAVDQKVNVRVDSFPDRVFAGHIGFVSRDAEFTPSNVQTPEERSKQVFRIKVWLDEGLDVLRAGMAADVLLGRRR